MNELEVNCVERSKGNAEAEAGHHAITHLGHMGFACRIPVALAIQQIRGMLNRFYTVDPAGKGRVYIEVRREAGRCPYLQARLGGDWTEHLLLLPTARPAYRLIRDGAVSGSRLRVRFMAQR